MVGETVTKWVWKFSCFDFLQKEPIVVVHTFKWTKKWKRKSGEFTKLIFFNFFLAIFVFGKKLQNFFLKPKNKLFALLFLICRPKNCHKMSMKSITFWLFAKSCRCSNTFKALRLNYNDLKSEKVVNLQKYKKFISFKPHLFLKKKLQKLFFLLKHKLSASLFLIFWSKNYHKMSLKIFTFCKMWPL